MEKYKYLILSFALLMGSKLSVQSFDKVIKKYSLDTIQPIREVKNKIASLKVFHFNDSLTKEITITKKNNKSYREYNKVSYYKNGLIHIDSSFSKKNRRKRKTLKKEFHVNGKRKSSLKIISHKVKGIGIGETYSWGNDVVKRRKTFNRNGKLISTIKEHHFYTLKRSKQ